ncbi:unnamed protein product, partial [Ectocarpus sp. 12 AP-2014]
QVYACEIVSSDSREALVSLCLRECLRSCFACEIIFDPRGKPWFCRFLITFIFFVSLWLGGWPARKKHFKPEPPSFTAPGDIIFPSERKGLFTFCVGHKVLHFTFSACVRPTTHRASCFWDASRGYGYDHTPLARFVDVVGLKPPSDVRF